MSLSANATPPTAGTAGLALGAYHPSEDILFAQPFFSLSYFSLNSMFAGDGEHLEHPAITDRSRVWVEGFDLGATLHSTETFRYRVMVVGAPQGLWSGTHGPAPAGEALARARVNQAGGAQQHLVFGSVFVGGGSVVRVHDW